jgi:type I restriction enzyme S subunit
MTWDMVRLGDVCEINPSIKGKFASHSLDMLVSFLPMERMEAQTGLMYPFDRKLGEVKKGYTYFENGDVLFAKITPCMQNGKHAIARNLTNGIGFGSTEFHILRPRKNIISEWIYFFINQRIFLLKAENYFQGTVGQQRLSDDFLKEAIIPLPPLDEQRRIAAEIERQLALVEKAKQAAIEQVEAAWALNAAYLREVFEGNNWDMVELGEICSLVNGDAYRDSDWSTTGTPIIRIQNLNDPFKSFNYWAGALDNRVVINDGDLLLAWSGTPGTSFGAHIWERGQAILNQHIFKVIVNMNVNLSWLKIAINRELDTMIGKAHGAVGLRHITKKETEKLKISIPSLDEQHHVVEHLEKIISKVKNTLFAVQSQLDTINALPAAILRQAFSGRL